MNELALFAGAGGGLLASRLLGWNTVCAVEIEKYPRDVLLSRQRDGMLERFPIWDDVKTFDGRPWRGKIDVISGGFPCQDISSAGKGAGLAGERSGLWSEYKRIIEEVRPKFVFAENSPLLRTRGLGTVVKDLDTVGYDSRWCVLGAGHLGALHKRSRIWLVAHAMCQRLEKNPDDRLLCQQENTEFSLPLLQKLQMRDTKTSDLTYGCGESDVLANRVDRLKAIGNGQVPIVAATAWNILTHDF